MVMNDNPIKTLWDNDRAMREIESLRQQVDNLTEANRIMCEDFAAENNKGYQLEQQLADQREAFAVIAETPIFGEQDDITMEAKDRIAKAIRAWEPR